MGRAAAPAGNVGLDGPLGRATMSGLVTVGPTVLAAEVVVAAALGKRGLVDGGIGGCCDDGADGAALAWLGGIDGMPGMLGI